MVHHVTRKDGLPPGARNRLEGWLVRKIHAGALKRLPRYYPLGSLGGQCPEQYALTLLAGLRKLDADARTRERFNDDGRAFRSWAESTLARPVPCPDTLDDHRARSLFA